MSMRNFFRSGCVSLKVGFIRSGSVLRLLCGLVFAAMLCAVPGFSQQTGPQPQAGAASLSGKITTMTGENTTNNIPGIAVKLTGPAPASTSQTAVSDSDGKYQFTHLAPGNYTLETAVEGFKPETATVTLAPGQTATQDVALQISAVEERVEVQGEATEIATQSVTATATVNEQQLQILPLRTEKFTEALSVSPSVIRTQE